MVSRETPLFTNPLIPFPFFRRQLLYFTTRQVTEQNIHIQGLNAVLAEKNCQINDMRRQIERSMSINRLNQLRASQAEPASKKPRKRAY